MKWTAKTLFVLASTCCLMSCDLQKEVSRYHGDGTIQFVKGPLLGIDGVALTFDTFPISSNFDRTYTCSNVPPCKDDYALYLSAQGSERLPFLDDSVISAQLTDSKGQTVWNIRTNIAPWTCAYGGGDTWVSYYYLVFDKKTGAPSGTLFTPETGEKYQLHVSFETNPLCSNQTTKAFFCLKAGGYK